MNLLDYNGYRPEPYRPQLDYRCNGCGADAGEMCVEQVRCSGNYNQERGFCRARLTQHAFNIYKTFGGLNIISNKTMLGIINNAC